MSIQNRRSSLTSSQTTSLAKRQAESFGKAAVLIPEMAKKRPALANVTNQKHGSRSSMNLVKHPAKIDNSKKGNSTNIAKEKPCVVVPKKNSGLPICDGTFSRIIAPSGPCSMDLSPDRSDDLSVSMDESVSTCDSLKSPEVEYIDKSNVAEIDSIERKTCNKLHISDHVETPGNICKKVILDEMETSDKIVDVDDKFMDPQMCATMACDIYKHLRASEVKKRPSVDFMEKVQTDINISMRAILVDWLVEVSEEYRLVPDTLYLTVNYIDRYLSGNAMDRQRLQLLGVACMMIASKYEEICPPQVEEFCYITDNTYFKDEVFEMESAVLNFLKFELTAPTVKCFLRRFVRAAQGGTESSSMQLECMANYLAELSLLEYSMLRYAPSLIAASAIFLARFILLPPMRPWNSTLKHYAQYEPSDLRECVNSLHNLACNSLNSSLPAIREKYSQHKYKFVAKYNVPSIPQEYFLDISDEDVMSRTNNHCNSLLD